MKGCSDDTKLLFEEILHDSAISDIKHNFFASKDPFFRAYVALALGCDVYPGGINNIGPAKLSKIINESKEQESPATHFQNTIINKAKISSAEWSTLVHAFLGSLATANDDQSITHV